MCCHGDKPAGPKFEFSDEYIDIKRTIVHRTFIFGGCKAIVVLDAIEYRQ